MSTPETKLATISGNAKLARAQEQAIPAPQCSLKTEKTGFVATPLSSLLTPDDVVAYLRISKPTLYRLVEQRVIPFFKVSGTLRFSHEDITAFVASGRVEPVK
jgi:excisionase family DNA binding protein